MTTGPAFDQNNQIDLQESYKQQTNTNVGGVKGPVVDILKQWCFSSQMGQQELTGSFKKLVNAIKSNPSDESCQQMVMNERICTGVSPAGNNNKQQQTVDEQAHQLIKDVYMDALIACKSRECTQQLLKIIEQQPEKVDTIRASYYMTSLAVTEKEEIKSSEQIKQLVDSFVQQQQQTSETVERQKLFAVTAMVGKYCQDKPTDSQAKQMAQEVAKTIVERYLRPVSVQEVQQYQQQQQQAPETLIKKIAKRSAALKALANLPGHVTKEVAQVEEQVMAICQNKQELITVRQSAIECLEQNDKAQQVLKQITFDQEEPIEVRVAAYRALMTVAYSADSNKNVQQKEQVASQIIGQLVKHCEDSRNQQEDEQFVLYVISHLDNIRSSQQPEYQAIRECIEKNKQHYMQIQVLCKKFKHQLADVRRSSRNYKLEQEFNQIESGLILEGDLIYESTNKHSGMSKQFGGESTNMLPKVIRVNMSMPVMGETVNVVEITLRQNQMDEELLSALKLVQDTKFSSQSVSKVVDSFKSTVEKQQQQKQQDGCTEADLTVKIDGCTVVYLTIDDFKTTSEQQANKRNTRSVYSSSSIVDELVAYLKRSPISFNRGINFNINQRIAKLLDLEASLIAGLRFESRAQGHSGDNFELVTKVEPRFNFEAIVGPAKMGSKKLLQRVSTKSAIGMRLRFKRDQLVDVQIDLPMKTMELFTFETQMVEKSPSSAYSYQYLPDSIYGQEDIYQAALVYPNEMVGGMMGERVAKYVAKRSIFDYKQQGIVQRLMKGNSVQHTFESSQSFARATGLRAKLHLVAAPKDMGLLVSCLVDKYEPTMQGYRMVIQQTGSGASSDSYVVQFSTPGSRTERQMELSLSKQVGSQRSQVRVHAQMAQPKMDVSMYAEIVHDGRQYSVKSEIVGRPMGVASSAPRWRHSIDCGLMIVGNSKSPVGGRIAQLAYKPYLLVDSSALRRPVQLQGTIAYSEAPKSVISYELKCPTSGDYIQGKLIVDQRSVGRLSAISRSQRSMQSPLELVLSKDLTLTNELVAQVSQHAVKVHNMLDWDAQRIALQADSSVSYKNVRKQTSDSVSCQLKFDAEQQLVVVERKCPEQQQKEFRATVKSEWRAPGGHQMLAEIRYQPNRRASVQQYKHKIDINQLGQKQYECQMEMELVDSERDIAERYTGRTRVTSERKQKSIQIELANQKRQQVAKLMVDFESLGQHQVQAFLQTSQLMHKCELRNNERQFAIVSRTDKHGQTYAKALVELNKVEGQKECKVVLECAPKRLSMAADVKFESGRRSSVALKSGRFVSQAEFSFETISRPFYSAARRTSNWFVPTFGSTNLKFRQQLKDLQSNQAYWMDSALNAANWDKEASYLRFQSPVYRADVEFDPIEQATKFGAYALRSKRSINNQEPIYSSGKHSSLANFLFEQKQTGGELAKQLGQSGKLWMLRAAMSSPLARKQLEQQARRALFQYADNEQVHQHSFDYQPKSKAFAFDFDRSPIEPSHYQPLKFRGDFSAERPMTVSLDSALFEANFEASPRSQQEEQESYARFTALGRHPRAAFKEHESEWRYKKDQGHKAWMKHVDAKGRKHELRAQTERDAKNGAKVDFESDKHGKASWEHKWRKHAQKRSPMTIGTGGHTSGKDYYNDQEEHIYANKFELRAQGPQKQWMHETSFEWDEPLDLVEGRRHRRSVLDEQSSSYGRYFARYAPLEYLKHTGARFNSYTQNEQQTPIYKLDFDYKPQLGSAKLDIHMPEDMMHSSYLQVKPTERYYKLQSKLYNQRNQDAVYDFSAATRPFVGGLATENQEPVFVHCEHPMLERPIDTSSLAYKLLKQPIKLNYNDKYGRIASFDYDELPIESQKYSGLRQKRAAIYYKDNRNDFEHSTSYDFYPETVLGSMRGPYKSSMPMVDELVLKTETKYGPVVVRADTSDVDNMHCQLTSPIVNVKLTAELAGTKARKVIKFHADNKDQRVQLAKLLRKAPETIRECEPIQELARQFDSARFEHDTELFVSLVEAIFKLKSQTKLGSRQTVVIEGEWNEQQGKAYAKINGDRVEGQCAIDLVRKSAELALQVENKEGQPIKHNTRLVRTSDNFYTLESSATIGQSRPLFKIVGKISALVFEEPEHLFARRTSRKYAGAHEAHISTFEAVVYEPKEYIVSGMYDCANKEARLVCKSPEDNKLQETFVRYDDQTDTIVFDSRLKSPEEGQVYATKAKINLGTIIPTNKCYYYNSNTINKTNYYTGSATSCASEATYEDRSGVYGAKYQPGEYISYTSPRGKQTFKLDNYFY